MAAGELSEDQARYRAALEAATGLDRTVITSWIGAESGWNRSKSDHNYLNIGPGRTYSSTTEAAQDAARVLQEFDWYSGIREAIAAGDPAQQVNAIWMSPWDAGHYGGDGSTLRRVWEQLTGRRVPVADKAREIAGGVGDVVEEGKDFVSDPAGYAGGKVVEGVAALLGSGTVRELIVRSGLTVFLLGAAGWLIVTGLLRLTRIDNTAYGVVTDLLPG